MKETLYSTYFPILIILLKCTNFSQCLEAIQTNDITNILSNNYQNDVDEYCSVNKQQCCTSSINLDNFDLSNNNLDNNCFRAAVYEHSRIDRYVANNDWLETIKVNLRYFKKASELAAINGANIIVFPEDGILIGKRDFIDPSLPELPDPGLLNSSNNNPCDQPEHFDGVEFELLRNLSCIAKENRLYVVANFGTKLSCQPNSIVGNVTCPKIGYLAFNTDIVLKSDGVLLKRYRKYNLFIEPFDKAPIMEAVYFDSPYGRFGVFTCFDLIFKSPAIDLVELHNVDTILFPTLWYDELPILSAIQYQDGWSLRNQVNLLASNLHKPETGTVGSGIYSGKYFIYTNSETIGPKLLIATIPKHPRELSNCNLNFEPLMIDIDSDEQDFKPKKYSHKNYTLLESDKIYLIDKKEEKKTICNNDLCCTIDYKINDDNFHNHENRIILIIRDNLRPGLFNWYEQVCMLATLTEPCDKNLLKGVHFSQEGLVKFDKLLIEGLYNLETYVYPIGSHSTSYLIDRSHSELSCDYINEENLQSCKFRYLNKLDKNINSFGMYGRLYKNDKFN